MSSERLNNIKELRSENIAVIYRSTAIVMIFNELTAVTALLIDGIITSQGLGIDVYSGISLLGPFSSVIFMITGVLSTGCNIVCSRLVGAGKSKEANQTFNLALFIGLAVSLLLVLLCIILPSGVLTICGVSMNKYPDLHPHMFGYLKGYLIGIPALMMIQIFGPVLVMDGGKRLFTVSAITLCAVDILMDFLNVFVLHLGAFGMGLATSVSFIVQFLMLAFHFLKRSSYFKLSLKECKVSGLKELMRNGTPALVKKLSGTLRDILINYINIMVAVSAVAIAARGIQNDLFQFLYCIPTGLARTLITMVGLYYGTNDLQGLKKLLSYAFRFSMVLSGSAGLITFIFAPYISRIYTSDPEVITLAVFSIRCMSGGLVFDTVNSLVQHYLQGTDNLKQANLFGIIERFVAPVASALILGSIFGSKGILASVAFGKVLQFLIIILTHLSHFKEIRKNWTKALFLPQGFGGDQSNNMYANIQSVEDAIRVSEQTFQFCLQHNANRKDAFFTSLFVEEMTVSALERAKEKKKKRNKGGIDFRLFTSGDSISFSLMDLGEHFDPLMFYELNKETSPEACLGIRIVTGKAKEVRYFSTFKSNNLTVIAV